MELFFLFAIIYLVYTLFFLSIFSITLWRGDRFSKTRFSLIVMTFSEIIYTVVGPIIGFSRFDEYGPEIPFAKEHILIIIFLVIVSSVSFWIARFTHKSENPFLRILISVGLLQGIALCIVTTIHFLEFIPLGIIYPFMGFELLSPFFALLILSREFYLFNKKEFNHDDALPYRQELGFVPIPFKIIQAPFFNRLIIYSALLIPVILIQMVLTYGFGQDIDAIVKAFTHSVGFVFSN